MKILFIAPIPPPISGHSLASQILLSSLEIENSISVVDLSKENHKDGSFGLKRIIEVIRLLKEVWLKKKDADVIYLTISESLAGNLKDLMIYIICFSKLNKMYIHLHGGSLKKLLLERYNLLFKINRYFIGRLGGAIVLGQSHVKIFSDLISKDKIHIVPNFAEDYFFLDESQIRNKFSNTKPLKILFLSNLLPDKGYNELLTAYLELEKSTKEVVQLDFAGRFESNAQEKAFMDKITEGVKYHGVAYGVEKKKLLSNAHVFCLPTSYLEGQPISILEAYAAGCVVVTTNSGGICDIFTNGVNGFEIEKKSIDSIKKTITKIIQNKDALYPIALANHKTALSHYKTTTYSAALKEIIKN